jgi:hypothetical protein
MTDISGAMAANEEGGPTLPIEGRRRLPSRANGKGYTGQILPTERTAGLMVLGALAAIYVLRVLFNGALGD